MKMEVETEVIGYPQTNVTVEEIPQIIGLQAVDHLVLTAVLLLSLGVSLNGTFADTKESTPDDSKAPSRSVSRNSEQSSIKPTTSGNYDEEDNEKKDVTIEEHKERADVITEDISSPTLLMKSILPSFVNSLSLFSISGEVYRNDISVLFFFFGVFLSVAVLALSGIPKIFRKSRINTISSYLRKRYNTKAASYLVASSAIVRHIFGGTLNVYVAGLAASAAAGLPTLVMTLAIIIISAIAVTVGGIQSESSYGIGSLWLGILCFTTFTTLCVSTSHIGGFSKLISKANAIDKLQGPRLSPALWTRHSYWSLMILGIFFGFQVFLLPRTSLKHLRLLGPNKFYIGLLMASSVMVIWAVLASWAGLCSVVTFTDLIQENSSVINEMPVPEGSLMVLVALKMHHIRGFRGFFLASLLAASISGLMRRFNQIIAVIWEVAEMGTSRKLTGSFSSLLLQSKDKELPEDLVKEIKWRHNHKKNCVSFAFKAFTGLLAAGVCIAILWTFNGSTVGCWELWQGIIGVVCGSVIGAILLGIFFPCFPQMSVVLGLIVGWCVPCYLVLGNISQGFSFSTEFESSDLLLHSPHKIPELSLFKEGFNFSGGFDPDAFNEDFFQQQNEWRLIGNNLIHVKQESENEEKFDRNSNRRKKELVDTSYCYYGLMGTFSCIVTALIFTAATNRCEQKEFREDLIHPVSHRFMLKPKGIPALQRQRQRSKKVQTFSTLQAKAGL